MKTIGAKRVARYLKYNPKDGHIEWIRATHKNKESYIGKFAGTKAETGYIVIKIFGKIYGAHRLAWLLTTGKWPRDHIDHKNGVRDDNRWENLRIGGYTKNAQNRPAKAGSRLGLKGVMYVNDRFRRRPYAAKIGANGRTIYLGYFSTPEMAHLAYCKAASRLHKKFARFR